MPTSGTPAWDRLSARLRGRLVLPADDAYESSRQLQIAEYDRVHPAGIVFCRSANDVREALLFAAGNGLPVVPRSGRHNFAGFSTCDGLVVDTSGLDHVAVTDRTVVVGAGAPAVEVVEALQPHDRQLVTGICPTVCMGGYVLGGGIGWQTRGYGPASDRLVAATLVTATGDVVRASAAEHPDLFWALRGGGGGNFGVLVDLELRPIEVPRFTNFTVSWAWDHVLDLMEQWQSWATTGSRGLSSEIGALLVDAEPGAVPVVFMHGAYMGPQSEADEALDELCRAAGADPQMRMVRELPYAQAMRQLYRCEGMSSRQRRRAGENPEAALLRQPFLRERHRLFERMMDRSALGRALEAFDADRRAGQFRYFAMTSLGGAANEVDLAETAYVHRDAEFLGKYTLGGMDQAADYDAEYAAAAQRWVDGGFAVLDPLSNGHSYVNYPDPALTDWQWSYYGGNYSRLTEVKKAYDPDGLFGFAQSIGR